ncbi:hypothetical protein THAOC_34884 [Thalassiosira oceanica]|uniref:Uncharacterized protein n=1 Tax=Thalassiosira oceanica TaxID=159749 RepID=K0R2Q7_THAOC|nr:hypothetical protein THAOC_34884 [Thalassiosira oceanica]|eukprot:EJK46445.1 hypothetical protein THAOC_34884 [Thalassiosira oceanica]
MTDQYPLTKALPGLAGIGLDNWGVECTAHAGIPMLAQSPGEPLHGPFLRPRDRRTTNELNNTTSEPDERRTTQKAPVSTQTCTSDQAARSEPRDCLICKELLAYVRRTTVPYSLELHNIPGGTSTTTNRKPPNPQLSCPCLATKGGALKDDNFPGILKTVEARRNLHSLPLLALQA